MAAPRLVDDTGFLLSRASAVAVRTTNTVLEPFGLRVRQYSLLLAVGENGGLSQRELAELLYLDPSQIVALLDELEVKGLVNRHPDPRDRRTRLIAATAEGVRVAVEAEVAVREAREQYLGKLDDDDRATLAALLGQIG